MMHKSTIDQVISRNLKKLREDRKWSRRVLAEKLTLASDRTWKLSRIVDLEGGRARRPPAPVQWRELVSFCMVFEVPLWSLVLTEPGSLVITAGGKTDEFGRFVGNRYVTDASHLAEILSGMPGQVFVDEEQKDIAKSLLSAENLNMAVIEAKEHELAELLSQYRAKIHPEIADVQDARGTEGDRSGEHS
jgi:hypothetical protein